MIKALIADDENQAEEGLQAQVDWEALGIQIVGTASSVSEALEQVRRTAPDLAIVSVPTPGCTGLELVEQLRELSRDLFFLLVSDRTDLVYMKRALQLGVSDYLCKPVGPQEWTETLTRLKSEIEVLRREQSAADRMQRTFVRARQKVRASYLMRLWDQRDLRLPLEQIDREYQFSMQPGRFRGFLVKLDYEPEELSQETAEAAAVQARKTVLQSLYGSCFDCELWFESGIGLGICNYPERAAAQIREQMVRSLQKLQEGLHPGLRFSIALAAETDDPLEIGASIWAAQSIIQERLVCGNKKVLTYNFPFSNLPIRSCVGRFLRQFRRAAEGMDAELVRSAAAQLKKAVLGPEKTTGREIFRVVSWAGEKLLEEWSEAETYEQDKYAYLQRCTLCGTPEQLFACLERLSLSLLEAESRRKAGGEAQPLLTAKQFMETHYMENLTLEQVAGVAGFNPNYFSSQFKREFGMGFQDSLTQIRIGEAKELLCKTDLPIAVVCSQVGYQDIRTFNRAFKKAAEMSPSQFKKLHHP